MISLDCVSRVKWNKDLGSKIKTLRGKTSRRQFAENLMAKGVQCSHQYIQVVEDGRVDSLDVELLVAFCLELNVSVKQIIPAIYVEL